MRKRALHGIYSPYGKENVMHLPQLRQITKEKRKGIAVLIRRRIPRNSLLSKSACLPDDRHTITVLENGKNPRRRHSAARPKVSGKTALFPRNDRPYGLKCKAFQTEIALRPYIIFESHLPHGLSPPLKKRVGGRMGGLGGRFTRTPFLASLRKGWALAR